MPASRRRTSAPSSPARWRRRASTPTACRAISGSIPDVPIEMPAHMVQRVCGTGIEVLMQAADFIAHKDIELALCVGAESMSRNPVASYTMRGFRMGAVDFKDFLWEALLDPAANVTMGDTAENLARQYQITRPQVDAFAVQSFERALAAQHVGLLRRRDRAGQERAVRAPGLPAARAQAARHQGAGHRHPCAPLAARGARRHPAGLRRRADRRQFLRHRRRRRGGAGRVLRLCQEARQARRWRASSRAPPSACRPRSWASARCRRSRRCSRAPASRWPISTASRSTKPSARR